MTRRIRKVTVLGSGVMGSGIACHLANGGLEVKILDILPKEAHQDRNSVAKKALDFALASKPAPLYKKEFATRITVGNFEDDLPGIADADWVLEVVVEKAEIKKSLFEKVDQHRKPGSLITTNTSGIPISQLAMGRSDDFRSHFCGTHFFNPARYMGLLEIIPHHETQGDVIDFLMGFGETFLGKRTVLCKDTPAFIANRIGFYSGNRVAELTEKYALTIEEVDKITGEPIGWPNTGSYRLLDLVGLDTSVHVTRGVIENCPDDEYVRFLKNRALPKSTAFLLEKGFLGDKSGQGFYKKTDQRDEKGKRVILALDLQTLEYKPAAKPNLPVVGIAKKIEMMDRRLKEMISSPDPSGLFVKELLIGIIGYAANRVPEISNTIYSLDQAMKSGYAWTYGPFELWDQIGLANGAALIREIGGILPTWFETMTEKGFTSFYEERGNKKMYYDIATQTYLPLPGAEKQIILDLYRKNPPVYKNAECTLHDIGDNVLCFEFTSKSNTIGEGVGEGALEALRICADGNWKGLVIGNNARNFSVGANLMAVGMVAMQKDFDRLEAMVHGFQQINMAIRYAPFPIITATQGYVFGGGCEILMHTDGAVCSAESYIGLVEVGVGLIPGGGGTKEFAVRASDSFFDGDVQIPTLLEKLKVIATATVSTSAHEGFLHGYLLPQRDSVEINPSTVLYRAKHKVLALAEQYVAPAKKEITVLGRGGLGALYTAINEFFMGGYMSAYDVEIARKIAFVLCGGDLSGQQKVSEQYLLDLEKEAFLQLLGNQKTLDRIQYLLINNKPLRN
jgi:3-hydroxyacyl-CoA dehydrogenase